MYAYDLRRLKSSCSGEFLGVYLNIPMPTGYWANYVVYMLSIESGAT